MSKITDQIDFNGFQVDPTLKSHILFEVDKAIWAWFNLNSDKVIISKRIIFFTLTLKVKDLRFFIEEIAGPEIPA